MLEQVPELRDPGRSVTPIIGGITNRNYRVVTGHGDYVVRISVRETGLLGIDRDNEEHNSVLAAAAGVGAPVIARVRDPEALVVGYLPSVTLTPAAFRDARRISVLAAQLRKLHRAPPFARDFDMVALQRRYHAIVLDNGYPLPEDYAAYADRAATIGELVTRTRTETAPCHNDLMPGNFLECRRPGEPHLDRRLRVFGQQRSVLRPRRRDQRARARCQTGRAASHRVPRAAHRPQELARARLWALMSQYGWSLWGSIRIGTTGDPEIVEWARALWERTVAGFDSPEFDGLLERASRPDDEPAA